MQIAIYPTILAKSVDNFHTNDIEFFVGGANGKYFSMPMSNVAATPWSRCVRRQASV